MSAVNTLWFKNMADHDAQWDYKRKAQWENDIGVPYLGIDGLFIWDGAVMNAEQFGNMHYGIVATAMGYPSVVTYFGGGAAAKGIKGALLGGPFRWGDTKEDHYWIKKGIHYGG
ncbi:MAG: polymorphic toxin type 44 domain-containing protein [Clostridia bacterium]|nr:polymorphic toxin type 44 domain-containing protein [Clostridia bacterium]MDD4375394.1 polymorphic toxin type 44 domain-containing protein [Clostridia bacterium]